MLYIYIYVCVIYICYINSVLKNVTQPERRNMTGQILTVTIKQDINRPSSPTQRKDTRLNHSHHITSSNPHGCKITNYAWPTLDTHNDTQHVSLHRPSA